MNQCQGALAFLFLAIGYKGPVTVFIENNSVKVYEGRFSLRDKSLRISDHLPRVEPRFN